MVKSDELFAEPPNVRSTRPLEGYCTHGAVWNVAVGKHQVFLRGIPRIKLFVGVFELFVPRQDIPTRALVCVSSTAGRVWSRHFRKRGPFFVRFNVRIHLMELHTAFVDRSQPRRGRVTCRRITRVDRVMLVQGRSRIDGHVILRVRGDSGNTIPPAPREVLLTPKRHEIDLFVSAPLFLVQAGHPISRGVKFRRDRSTESTRWIRRGSSTERGRKECGGYAAGTVEAGCQR